MPWLSCIQEYKYYVIAAGWTCFPSVTAFVGAQINKYPGGANTELAWKQRQRHSFPQDRETRFKTSWEITSAKPLAGPLLSQNVLIYVCARGIAHHMSVVWSRVWVQSRSLLKKIRLDHRLHVPGYRFCHGAGLLSKDLPFDILAEAERSDGAVIPPGP